MKSGEVKLFIGILIAAMILVGVAIYPMIVPPTDGRKHGPDYKVDPMINRAFLVPAWAPIKGNPKAPYTLVEFGDYQCPTCAKAQPLVDQALEKNKDKLNYVFHYFKVAREHYNADMLAAAAEAAAEQGKFWEMHRLLMDNHDALLTKNQQELAQLLMQLASQIKLDTITFRQALTGDKARNSVTRGHEMGDQAKLHGTPTFFVVRNSDGKAVMTVNEPPELMHWLDKPENLAVPPQAAAAAAAPK